MRVTEYENVVVRDFVDTLHKSLDLAFLKIADLFHLTKICRTPGAKAYKTK